MYNISKKITIEHVFSKSFYVQVNIQALPDIQKGITPSISATNKLLNADNINKNVLRNLISIDPNSSDWTKQVKDYYSSLLYIIPSGGKVFEAGFSYNDEKHIEVFAEKEKAIIKKYDAAEKELNPNDPDFNKLELALYNSKKDELFNLEVEKNKILNNSPVYGSPINKEEYIIYLYALYSPYVAKRFKDVDRGVKIKYVMYSEEENLKIEENAFKLQLEADEAYIKLLEDDNKVDYVLKVLYQYTQSMSKLDKQRAIKRLSTSSPDTFLRVVKDKKLERKAFIEDLVLTGIINKSNDSGVYTDGSDATIVIGTNMEEVLAFFAENNTINKAKASELTAKYKSLKK